MSDRLDAGEEQRRLDGIAGAYGGPEASITERQANRHAAREAVALVRGPDVLVLGAATGAWVSPLLERFETFDTVDAVAPLIEELERQHKGRVRGFVSLFERFEPPRPYDTLVLGHVLEHVHDPVGLLRRCRGWLQPGGRAVILVPNADSLHRQVGVALGHLQAATDMTPGDELLGHRRVYTRRSLRADVEAAGFGHVELGGLLLKPLSNGQMDAFDDELRQAFFALGHAAPEVACIISCVGQAG